ncbi:hypothetical protein ACFY41_32485 [Streptomyces syringium]|uniref:hypothetical protein n=1 Tax=Streptomyces syringium TaxID=76729 RepID=UPI00367B849D
MKAFDLTAGRYLNVHQCVYFSAGQHYTAVLPNAPNVNFNTGTNISNTADTTLNCVPGGGGWRLLLANSAVESFDLADNRHLNLHQCVDFERAVLHGPPTQQPQRQLQYRYERVAHSRHRADLSAWRRRVVPRP